MSRTKKRSSGRSPIHQVIVRLASIGLCTASFAGALGAQVAAPAQSCPVPATAAAQRISPGEVVLSPASADTGTRRATTSAAGRRGTSSGDIARPATRSARARLWTVQVASFETLEEATTEQQELCEHGYDARVAGAYRPFSVRVGHYPSADSALSVARRLTTKHLTPFVTADR